MAVSLTEVDLNTKICICILLVFSVLIVGICAVAIVLIAAIVSVSVCCIKMYNAR